MSFLKGLFGPKSPISATAPKRTLSEQEHRRLVQAYNHTLYPRIKNKLVAPTDLSPMEGPSQLSRYTNPENIITQRIRDDYQRKLNTIPTYAAQKRDQIAVIDTQIGDIDTKIGLNVYKKDGKLAVEKGIAKRETLQKEKSKLESEIKNLTSELLTIMKMTQAQKARQNALDKINSTYNDENNSIVGGSRKIKSRKNRKSRSSPPKVGRSQGLNVAKPHSDPRSRSRKNRNRKTRKN